MISVSEGDLRSLDLDGLRDLADRVGVGYADLSEEDLRSKIRFEGRSEEA